MKNDRRSFIRQTATLLGSIALHQTAKAAFPLHEPVALPAFKAETCAGAPTDPDFWYQIRLAYAASPNIINLNNGGVCPTPRATMDALDYYNRMCNEAPSYYMWRLLDQDREPLRENLATLAGVSAEEIAINRNATEALNTIIYGIRLSAGDEVVLSKYDYPNMINAWKQREKRDGIKLVWVDFKNPTESDEVLVNAYVSKFSKRTKVVHITHVINWTGQLLPVAKIADKAHEAGIEVLVDGAHSFALIDYKIPDLHCDYWGTSLHKWLCAPIGTGMMWVKKEKIADIWPLVCNDNPESDNIRKFETLGTRSFPIEMAIGYSLDLQNMIGTRRKQERLFYLKNYWMERVKDIDGLHFYTSMQPEFGCAIANVNLDGMKSGDLNDALFRDHKIHVVSIDWADVSGVRITPNVYTMESDLDKLVNALHQIAKKR